MAKAGKRARRGNSRIDHPQLLQRTALATAIAAIVTPAAQADWGRNVELFVTPTTKRTLFGGQLLQPLRQDNDSLLYFDFRGTFNPGDTDELNVGFGYRRLVADRNWILGGYSAFDTRTSLSDRRYNQVTFGLEALSHLWDLRGNYYLPLTDEKRVGTIAPAPAGNGFFSGFNLIQPFTAGSTIFEEALEGGEIEGGRLLDFIPFGESRLYFGVYHFDGDTVKSTDVGLRARLEFRPRKDIIFNVSHQHDELFGTETMVQVKYSFGYERKGGVRSLSERMVQFVERDVDIKETSPLSFADRTLSNGPNVDTVISTNVVHIDNAAGAGGDGSAESPFDSIASCVTTNGGFCGAGTEDAIIYVHAGDGTSTGLDETLELQDNERLIGQGFAFYGIGGDAFPVFTNGGTGVVLANSNEVAGLHFDSTGTGIYGANVTNVYIHDNQFSNGSVGIFHAAFGIGESGNASIKIANNTFSNNFSGVYLVGYAEDGGEATQTAELSNNTFTDNKYGINLYNGADDDGTTTQTVTLAKNVATANTFGLYARNFAEENEVSVTQTIDLSAGGNQFNGNEIGAVFENEADEAEDSLVQQVINLAGANNQFNDNDYMGARFSNASDEAKYSTVTQTVDLSGGMNQFKGNEIGATFENESDDGTKYSGTAMQVVDLSGGSNKFNNNSRYGAIFDNSAEEFASATQTVNLAGGSNQFNNNTEGGAIFANRAKYGSEATQSVDLSAGSNQFNGNGKYGAGTFNGSAKYSVATQTLDLTGGSNQFNGNATLGAFALNTSGKYGGPSISEQTIDMAGGSNQFNSNGYSGLIATNFSTGDGESIQVIDMSATASNQAIDNAKYGAGFLNVEDGNASTQFVDLTGTDLSGNGEGTCVADNDGGIQDITGAACAGAPPPPP